jgi:hypothetical protein
MLKKYPQYHYIMSQSVYLWIRDVKGGAIYLEHKKILAELDENNFAN